MFVASRLSRILSLSDRQPSPYALATLKASFCTISTKGHISRAMAGQDPTMLILCGPSGAGKSTVKERLIKEFPGKFGFSVSYTTRNPRPKGDGEMEEHGSDYFFVSMDEFDKMIERGEFVEHAVFGKNKYGTSLDYLHSITNKGQISLLDIEMEGVKQVHNSPVNTLTIFVTPPSLEILEERLRKRGTDSESAILQRLEQAERELVFAREASQANKGRLVVNDVLDDAYNQVRNWCLEAFPSLAAEKGTSTDDI